MRNYLRPTAAWTILIGLLAVAGCVRSLQPVLNEDQYLTDDSIVGRWVSTDDGDTNKLRVDIEKTDEKTAYLARFYEDEGQTDLFDVRLGKVGDSLVLQGFPHGHLPGVGEMYASHALPFYSFFILKQTHPQLVITSLSSKWLKEYLTAHPAEIQVLKTDHDFLYVNVPTADLQKFLRQHITDAGAMEEAKTFVPFIDPATQPSTSQPSIK